MFGVSVANSDTAAFNVNRLDSIDALRGIAIVIMTLDHVRDFFHQAAMSGSPTDLNTTTVLLFMTRWITHICAPIFALTAGFGAWAWWNRGRSKKQLSSYLLMRGALLVGLELTVMQFAYAFSFPASNPIFLLVLWSLGLSMMVLAALIWLPIKLVAVLALALILLHPMIGFLGPAMTGLGPSLVDATHGVGVIQIAGKQVIAPYPVIPWAAVMALGFCLGPLLSSSQSDRSRRLLTIGMLMLLSFLVMRLLNAYGDPQPWIKQPTDIFTLLSFINTTKYPASPAFLLMTLSPAFLLLAFYDHLARRLLPLWTVVIELGRVPLVYYVAHFFCAHLIATGMAFMTYGVRAADFIWLQYPSFGGPRDRFPPDFGYSLMVTYLMWMVVLLLSGALALAYGRAKARSNNRWLSLL